MASAIRIYAGRFKYASLVAPVVLAIASNNCQAQEYQSVPVLKGEPGANGKPVIESVQSTPLGYVITGRDFGGDPGAVRVLENDAPLSESAVVGVSSQRISVLSVPDGSTSIVVEVSGTASAAMQFKYVKPAEPPMPDMPTGEAPDDAEITTANVSMLPTRDTNAADSEDPAREPDAGNAEQINSSPTISSLNSTAQTEQIDLSREVMVLRKRLESLEEEIYQLRKLIVKDAQ